MAKEYIEREATIAGIENVLREKSNEKDSLAYFAFTLFAETLKKAPAADVVEVVRCKDCEYFVKKTNYRLCSHKLNRIFKTPLEVSSNHFCSYGKRKEGADNGVGVET